MQQVQMNNQTWAMPLMLQPAVMRYEPDVFAQAGAYSPEGTWSVDQFEDALRMLKLYLADGTIPYQPRSFDNSYLLMLIAAYGGLPLDYRTDPVTINFTDQTTIDASREVLDLAKDGYFEYSELAAYGGGGVSFIVSGEEGDIVPLYGQVLNSFSATGGFSLAGRGRGGGSGSSGGGSSTAESSGSEQTSYITSYPQSSQYVMASAQYTVVSYDLSAAYISANTQHTEACYRFISEMAQNPDFINLMPVRHSVIDSPEILNAQGEDNVAFYNALADLLLQSNVVEVPTTQLGGGRSGLGQIIESYWINRVFDRYVLQDADLETELAEAQVFTLAYRECAADIPPFDPALGNQKSYFTQFQDCATQVDPTANMFGG
jgi:ABC-type glycerol-3-phosphate transport system substrate-binding protein